MPRDDDDTPLHDVLGVGFGPANIALAAAIREEAPHLRCRFLETRAEVQWQPGLLLSGADIQNNPLRDLATLRNPRSRYTFVNYLFEQGRLLEYLNLPKGFPLRKDYALYVKWVADQFAEMVHYNRRAEWLGIEESSAPHYVVKTSSGHTYLGRALVVAAGRSPYVPTLFADALGDRVFHSGEYLWRVARWGDPGPGSAAIIGASQSAAEIALDLHTSYAGGVIFAIMRSFGYRLKDTSPFSEEAFLPEFIDYYHGASKAGRADLDAQLRPTNYSSVDLDVIDDLYLRRYEHRLDGRDRLRLCRNCEVTAVDVLDDEVRLVLRERHTGQESEVRVDMVVLATGYRDLGPAERAEPFPPLLESIAGHFAYDETGTIRVERDYRVPPARPDAVHPPLFLNGLCESSHGLGDAGSFSLLSLRARTLLTAITEHLRGGSL